MTYLFYVSGSNVLQDFFIYNGEPVGVVVPPNLIGKYKKKIPSRLSYKYTGKKNKFGLTKRITNAHTPKYNTNIHVKL